MANPIVGILKERAPSENRVSLTPETVTRLKARGINVIVETGAGNAAWYSDDDYRKADANIVDSPEELIKQADIITCIDIPETRAFRRDQILIGLLHARQHADYIQQLTKHGVTVLSLDLLPRTLSRAQSMDVLSSQANIAGYKAALVAADTYGSYFPMLTTAAGTSTPATVLILGTGVAGLSAIGTARRLGAIVTAYDVRPEAKSEIESVGAKFLELTSVDSGSGDGGYARALTDDERAAQQEELNTHIGRFDVVITTAKVPGRKPPLLVTEAALDGMRPGSVVVDMAASSQGGNVEGSKPDETFLRDGVTVIGAGNLASAMAPAASLAYGRNVSALLSTLVTDDGVNIDLSDEVVSNLTVTHGGTVRDAVITAQSPAETEGEEA